MVQYGDTLWDIALRFYDNGYDYRRIFEANGDLIDRPELIHSGMRLWIPHDIGEITADRVACPESYVVQPGDSLWSIAVRFYYDGRQWRRVFDANLDRISDPALIFPGMALQVPCGGEPR